MPNSPMQIGPMSLHGFEIPASVDFGGKYRLAIHRLSSGERIIEPLGPDDGLISFQASFVGPEAEHRARQLDDLRLAGESLWLSWKAYRRLILVQGTRFRYRSPTWIDYSVTCLPVVQPGTTSDTLSGLATLLASDLQSAMGLVPTSLAISLASAQTALGNPNSLTPNTAANTQALGTLNGAISVLGGMMGNLSNALIAPSVANATSYRSAQSVMSTVSMAGTLASTVMAKAYLGRMGYYLRNGGA